MLLEFPWFSVFLPVNFVGFFASWEHLVGISLPQNGVMEPWDLGWNQDPGPLLCSRRWGWDLSYQQLVQGFNTTFSTFLSANFVCSKTGCAAGGWALLPLSKAGMCSGLPWALRAAPTCTGGAQTLQKAKKLPPHFLCQVCLSLSLYLPGIMGSPGTALLIITSKYLFKV